MRNKEMDMIKGICICLMVLGHAGIHGTVYIYLFHMPVFMIVAGFFYKTNDPNFWDKNIKGLYLPYVIYNLIFLIFRNILINLNFYGKESDFIFAEEFIDNVKIPGFLDVNTFIEHVFRILRLEHYEVLGTAGWFVAALFLVKGFYKLIDSVIIRCIGQRFIFAKIIKGDILEGIIRGMATALILCLGYYCKKYNLDVDMNMQIMCSSLILFDLGRNINRYWDYIKKFLEIKYRNYILLVLAVSVLGYCANKGTIGLGGNYYLSPMFLLICSFTGFFLALSIVNIIKLSKIKLISQYISVILSYIGKNTMAIVFLHFLAFKIITLIKIFRYNISLNYLSAFPTLKSGNGSKLWILLYFTAGIAIPLGIDILISKRLSHKIDQF